MTTTEVDESTNATAVISHARDLVSIPQWDEAPDDFDPLERRKLSREEFENVKKQYTKVALRELKNRVQEDPHLILRPLRRRELDQRGILGLLSDEVRSAAGLSGGRDEKERAYLAAFHRDLYKVDALMSDESAASRAPGARVLSTNGANSVSLAPHIKAPKSNPSGKKKISRSRSRANWAWKQLSTLTTSATPASTSKDKTQVPCDVGSMLSRGVTWTYATRDALARSLKLTADATAPPVDPQPLKTPHFAVLQGPQE